MEPACLWIGWNHNSGKKRSGTTHFIDGICDGRGVVSPGNQGNTFILVVNGCSWGLINKSRSEVMRLLESDLLIYEDWLSSVGNQAELREVPGCGLSVGPEDVGDKGMLSDC